LQITRLLDYPITKLIVFVVVPNSELLYCSVRVVKADSKPASRRRSPQPKRTAQAKRIGRFLVLLVALVLIVDGLVGDRGLVAMLRARRQYDELSASTARQRAENARLREEARRLRDDPSAIEEIARRELGLIRPGEKVFIVKDLKAPPAP
jgi:cell division protein FtsB